MVRCSSARAAQRGNVGQGSNTVSLLVGRLVEARIEAGFRDGAEVDVLFNMMAAEMAKAPAGQRIVTVADWRHCPIMEEKAAERFAQRMSGNNPRIARSAALVSPESPIANLQFARLIRESNFDDRRMFTQAAALIAWLAEVLTPPEQARLRAFLGEDV